MKSRSGVKEAFHDWAKLQPIDGGACCIYSHFSENGHDKRPKPDDLVCRREQAWRKYVRLRDGDPMWPFTNKD